MDNTRQLISQTEHSRLESRLPSTGPMRGHDRGGAGDSQIQKANPLRRGVLEQRPHEENSRWAMSV